MALKLLHFEACPFCEKVRLSLKRMGLRHDGEGIDPGPPPAARVGADGGAADAQAEAKPKRRWWRRSFSRG